MSYLTRKIKLFPVGDKEEVNRVYKYLRDGIKSQNMAMNQYMSALYIAEVEKLSKDDRKELNHLYTRISGSRKGSAYDESIEFAKGLPSTASVGMEVSSAFSKACKDGLMYGKVSLPTYRDTNPLLVHVDYVRLRSTNPHCDNGMYHNYESHTEFLEHLKNDRNVEIFIKFAHGITFKLIVGALHKSAYLREELKCIFEEYYTIGGSSIQVNDKDIILNLSIDVPQKENQLDENIVVGVDLGLAIPAMCSVNNSKYKRERIGSADDFVRQRTKIQAQRRRIQSSVRSSNGGHGREKKLRALDRFHKTETNWVKNYNHYVSRRIVDFALKNNAKYINLECLKGFGDNDKSSFILRNWSYFELQTYIEYKAAQNGIEVRKINPCYTSKVCSCCGHYEEGQRISQDKFICKSCGEEMNADFNASRNIAKSTLLVLDKKVKKETLIKEAKEYYGIE